MKAQIKFADAINQAISSSMTENENVICFGLGVTDPKHVFDTTKNLEEKFGGERVFDIPCSENAITGIGIGASLNGAIPVMTHQRLDFFLLAMDQLVNSAAKWYYMFGSQRSVPITIRLILGRGWGQGPTHAQNLQAWFAHIPGLKVVCPSNANDAYILLKQSIFDPNPVIFLEHRWLHNSISLTFEKSCKLGIHDAKVVKTGTDLTVVTSSYMVTEAIDAADYLYERHGISCEVIDLRSIRPIDYQTLNASVEKTKNLICIDTASSDFSVSSHIVSKFATSNIANSINKIDIMGLPNIPEPTSYGLTKTYYNDADDIINKVLSFCGHKKEHKPILRNQTHHDIPGSWFTGPF